MEFYKKMLMAAAAAGGMAIPMVTNTVHASGWNYSIYEDGGIDPLYKEMLNQDKYNSFSRSNNTNTGEHAYWYEAKYEKNSKGAKIFDKYVYHQYKAHNLQVYGHDRSHFYRDYTDGQYGGQLQYFFSGKNDYLTYFVPGVARYTDNDGKVHMIGLSFKITPANKYVSGVALPNHSDANNGSMSLTIIKSPNSYRNVGSVDINIKFMSTTKYSMTKDEYRPLTDNDRKFASEHNVYHASNNISDYKEDNDARLPFIVRDIDVGQYFKIANYQKFNFYIKNKNQGPNPASNGLTYDSVQKNSNKDNTDSVAYSSPGIFTGVGTKKAIGNNQHAWVKGDSWPFNGSTSDSLRSNGNVFMLAKNGLSRVQSVFGVANTNYVSKDGRNTAHGVSVDGQTSDDYNNDWNWNMSGSSYRSLYDFLYSDDQIKRHMTRINEFGHEDSYESGNTISFDIFGGFSLHKPNPNTKKKVYNSSSKKYDDTATTSTISPDKGTKTSTATYRVALTGFKSYATVPDLYGDEPQYDYLETLALSDKVYGASVSKDDIEVLDHGDGDRNVTSYFNVSTTPNAKEGYTTVDVKLKSNYAKNVTDDSYYVRFRATFDEDHLKAAYKYHRDMVTRVKMFKTSDVNSKYQVKNKVTTSYKYDGSSSQDLTSGLTTVTIPVIHYRPSDVPVEINKYVYANGDYSKNVDENVIGSGKIYNGNDVMTYKIALKFHRTKLDKADKDGDTEKRYFTRYKLTDAIKDMTDLKVVKTETSGGASANASLSGKDLTVDSGLSKNNEQTVNVYVSGRPIVNDLNGGAVKAITNSAKVVYWSKTDPANNNNDEDAYDGRYNNGQSFKDGRTSNTTKYRVHKLQPPATVKTVHETSKYGVLGTKNIANDRVNFNQKYTYTMSGSTERTGGTKAGKIVIADTDIDKRVTMLSADVVDTDGDTVARWNSEKDGKFYSANGLTIGDHTVTFIGDTNPDKPTKYTIHLMVQYTSHTTTKHMSEVIYNDVITSLKNLPYDTPKPTDASVKVLSPKVPPTGSKTTVSLDGGSPAKILNANSSHTVKYSATTTIGNEHDMDGYEITDQLPENTTLIGGASGVKMSFKEEDGYSGWQSGNYSQNDWDISYDKDKRLITARLVKNARNYTYVKATLDYSGTVKDHSDWSDYSQIRLGSEDQAKLSDSGNLILNGKELTGASYIMVPNLIYYKYPDGDTIKGRSWYRVQVKKLEVKQEITQNHENYTDYLKKSHYLPKTRSDATALTTRINIQMPNYLKITGFKSSSTPTSKMDKGVLSYKDHSNNDNGDNPDLTGKDLNLPSDLQSMSGREYYYYSKYSSKTKYYESYKKLDHMVDTFAGKVSLTSKEDGTENKTTNDVKVKLPNIYSYKDITSVISYPDKTATVTVHGQITGLAVDDNNPTNFDVEEKTYDENGPVTGQVKTSGGYVSPFTQINLANGIKTGQTALTEQVFKGINVTDLTGNGDSFTQTRTYRSSSTLTEKLGHSVVLTSDNTGDGTRKAPKYQDEFTHDIGTGDKDTERRVEQGKDNPDVFGDDGDKTRNETLIDQRQTVTGGNKTPKDTKLTKPNTTGDIPHETITYYDMDHYKNYVRNMEETYMFTGPDAVSAKAGYGFKDMHVLYAWTYSNPGIYKIKESSIDHIFNATSIKDANNEVMDYTTTNMTADEANYNKAFKESIKALEKAGYDVKTTMSSGNATYSYTVGLDKAKDDDKALIKKNEGIVKTEPVYYLRRYTLRYPKRVLVAGIQSLAGKGSDGGYANYIRDFDSNKSTNLTYTSNSFGTLTKMSIDASQIVYIYGHRSLTKTGSAVSNSRDEIVLDGTLSGKDVEKSDPGLAKFLNSNK